MQTSVRKRRVVILNWKDWRHPAAGGAEAFVRGLSVELQNLGFQVSVLTQMFPGASAFEPVDGIEIRRTGNVLTGYLSALRILKKIVAEDPEVSIIESVNTIPFLSRIVSHKVIYLVHHLAKTELFIEAPFPISLMLFVIERLDPIIMSGHRVITISNQSAQEIATVGIPMSEITVAHPGYDRFSAVPEMAPVAPRPPRVCYVGPLKRYKGVLDVVAAFEDISSEVPGAMLDIAGRGYLEGEVRSAIAANAARASITFHGFVSQEEKWKLLLSSSVFVYPSASEGGWSIAVHEAMIAGLPAIVTPTLSEMVLEGRGRVVRYGEPEMISGKVVDLLEHEGLRASIGARAQSWARQISMRKAAQVFADNLE